MATKITILLKSKTKKIHYVGQPHQNPDAL